eukprot:180201_1
MADSHNNGDTSDFTDRVEPGHRYLPPGPIPRLVSAYSLDSDPCLLRQQISPETYFDSSETTVSPFSTTAARISVSPIPEHPSDDDREISTNFTILGVLAFAMIVLVISYTLTSPGVVVGKLAPKTLHKELVDLPTSSPQRINSNQHRTVSHPSPGPAFYVLVVTASVLTTFTVWVAGAYAFHWWNARLPSTSPSREEMLKKFYR